MIGYRNRRRGDRRRSKTSEGVLNVTTDLIGDGPREHAGARDNRLVAAAVDEQ
jgi:hypothetical protein